MIHRDKAWKITKGKVSFVSVCVVFMVMLRTAVYGMLIVHARYSVLGMKQCTVIIMIS